MKKRIKNIFIIKFMRIGAGALLVTMMIFVALFALELQGQRRIYLENSRREAANLQDSMVSQLDYLIKWINFHRESRALLSIYEGDEVGRQYVYDNFKGWVDKNEVLTAIVLYDREGNKILAYSEEKDQMKRENFIKIRERVLKDLKKGEYHMVNKLARDNNTYFLHFIPVYDGDEKMGYLAAVGSLKNLMVQYEEQYRSGTPANQMGFVRISEDDRLEGVVLDRESLNLEYFKSSFGRRRGYFVTDEGDYVVHSKNIKEKLQGTEALEGYKVKYDDGSSSSVAVILLKKSRIMKVVMNVWWKYLSFYILTVAIILTVLYRYLKMAFENDLGKRRLRVKARKLNKNISAINTIVSVVGHDIKGPFTALLGGFSIITQRRDRMKEEQLTRYLRLMEEECRKACDFSENLMKWAVSQNGLYSYIPREVDLGKAVAKQVKEYRGMASLKEVEVEMCIPEGIICYSDKDILKTIIRNLLINAIKFTPAKGRISLRAVEKDERIDLVVEDTGMGIPGGVLRMLERDVIYSSKGSSGEEGNGMGLLLIKRLSRINQGNLRIKSQGEGGTTVIVTIPRMKREDSDRRIPEKKLKNILAWD